MRRRRRFRRPLAAWLLFVAAWLVFAIDVSWVLALALVAMTTVVLGIAWFVSPWNKAASNLVLPARETFDRRHRRSQRVADALGRVPVFGPIWRLAQRTTQTTVDNLIEQQRAMIDEEDGRDA